jgi:hypothetical protein
MSWKTVAVCDDCWSKFWHGRKPHRMTKREQETCDSCKRPTHSGIYVRRDPDKSFRMGPNQHLPESACTNCGHVMDAANCVSTDGEGKADPGDITVCIICGHVMAFADDMTLRDLTAEEAKEIAGNKALLALQEARGEVMKKHPELKDHKS